MILFKKSFLDSEEKLKKEKEKYWDFHLTGDNLQFNVHFQICAFPSHGYKIIKITSKLPNLPIYLLYHSADGQKIMFCAIKSFILNGSCSNCEYFSLKMAHIFLPSLKTLFSKIKIPLFNYHIKF